jgi:hypothetical protein
MLLITSDMHVMDGEAMRTSRLVIVVAACFAAGSLVAAQGRGHGPGGHTPQITRAGSGGPNVRIGNTGGRKGGNGGVMPGESGRGHGNAGTTAGNAGGGGRGNAGGRSRANADEDRGKGGKPPAENAGGRGNAGGGDRGDADNDQDAPGGRGQGGSDRDSASFVAKMNPQLRARLESMLPSGMTLDQAADGFRNQGQFIAALQQSKKHDISFGDLKAQMTGDNPISLGDAMRKLGVATDED